VKQLPFFFLMLGKRWLVEDRPPAAGMVEDDGGT